MQTLYKEVRQALEDAYAGKLDQTGVIAVLRRVQEHLDRYQEHLKAEAEVEAQRPLQALKTVLSQLSYSEEEGIKAVMEALPNPQGGLIVSAKIADEAGLSRSVIVNALSKFSGHGLIESRSLGQKGTHIKILFPGLREALLSVA